MLGRAAVTLVRSANVMEVLPSQSRFSPSMTIPRSTPASVTSTIVTGHQGIALIMAAM